MLETKILGSEFYFADSQACLHGAISSILKPTILNSNSCHLWRRKKERKRDLIDGMAAQEAVERTGVKRV